MNILVNIVDYIRQVNLAVIDVKEKKMLFKQPTREEIAVAVIEYKKSHIIRKLSAEVRVVKQQTIPVRTRSFREKGRVFFDGFSESIGG